MRWLYHDPADDSEAADRAAVLARVDAWWREFGRRAQDVVALFERRKEWDVAAWMADHLEAIHPDLKWEFGPAINVDGQRLVITPEADHHLRPLTQVILSRAPKLPDWEFYGYRLPEPLDMVRVNVDGRTGGDLTGTRAIAMIGEGNAVDIAFLSESCTGPDDRQALNDAFVACEGLLGEQVLNEWVGVIEVYPAQKVRNASSAIPLENLRPTVDAVIGAIVDQLPARPPRPVTDEGHGWTSLELQPEEADDYPQRFDLLAASTGLPEVWKAAHSGRAFYSQRFSRCGETFCYLKIDGRDGRPVSSRDRSAIEQAVDAALAEANLGSVTGGGTGLRYAYVDLALTDVRAAIPLLRETLRPFDVPQRTWLQFFDATLADEWVGMIDDRTPPPTSHNVA